jgi:hypothetical protein
MGVYVPYSYFEWALAQTEEEVLRLAGAQLVLAAVEDGVVVADFLVADRGLDAGAWWAAFTVRAHPTHRWGTRLRVPRQLRRWARRGSPVDISLRDRCGTPIVRFCGPHSEVALELESTAPCVQARSGERWR